MATATATRTRTKRSAKNRVTVADATVGPIAGALVGYASFGIIVIAATALAAAFDSDLGVLDGRRWREAGLATAIVAGAILLVAYFYGGFVAGRMAGSGGIVPGLLVFVAGVAMALAAAALVDAASDGDLAARLEDALRTFGMPGSWDEWREIGTAGGLSSLVGMLVGSLLGSRIGERKATRH